MQGSSKLKVLAADVSHAYIQAYTQEKVYTVAGPEFGPYEGRILIVDKALYGLQSSGARWRAKLADDLISMGYVPTKADPDLWIKRVDDHYEYIGVFVDDLLIFSKDPPLILKILIEEKGYELKNVGPPEYYNGADMSFNKNKWTMSAKTYIKNTCAKLEKLFEISFKNYGSPMEVGDHPEVDESDLLDPEEITKYQMIVGCAQWAITIGRYDIQYATNTMARFASAPREGHLKRMFHIFGYLKHHPKYRIVFDNDEPNYQGLHFVDYDWKTTYVDACEDIPDDMPEPLTREVSMTVYADANHGNCLVTRRSTTGIIVCINKTPIYTHSKRQNTIETSTYGTEFVASRIAVEKILEYRYKCRMLGIKITKPSILLLDNEAVVKNVTLPSSTLKKKHNAIAYHKTREAVAAGIVKIAFINSKTNRSDILTKPLGPQDQYLMTKDILFETNHVPISGN